MSDQRIAEQRVLYVNRIRMQPDMLSHAELAALLAVPCGRTLRCGLYARVRARGRIVVVLANIRNRALRPFIPRLHSILTTSI